MLNSGSSGLGLSPGRVHCVVFLVKTLNTHNTSLRSVYKWIPEKWTSIPPNEGKGIGWGGGGGSRSTSEISSRSVQTGLAFWNFFLMVLQFKRFLLNNTATHLCYVDGQISGILIHNILSSLSIQHNKQHSGITLNSFILEFDYSVHSKESKKLRLTSCLYEYYLHLISILFIIQVGGAG